MGGGRGGGVRSLSLRLLPRSRLRWDGDARRRPSGEGTRCQSFRRREDLRATVWHAAGPRNRRRELARRKREGDGEDDRRLQGHVERPEASLQSLHARHLDDPATGGEEEGALPTTTTAVTGSGAPNSTSHSRGDDTEETTTRARRSRRSCDTRGTSTAATAAAATTAVSAAGTLEIAATPPKTRRGARRLARPATANGGASAGPAGDARATKNF